MVSIRITGIRTMIDEILPAIIVIALFIAVAAIIVISIAFLLGVGWNLANGEIDTNGNIIPDKPPALKCIEFSDGTLAVIGKVDNCTGSYETISWFLSKGYHIAGIGADTGNYWYDVYLTR